MEEVNLVQLKEELEALKAEQDTLKQRMEQNEGKIQGVERALKSLSGESVTPVEEKAAPPEAKKERLERRIERLEDMAGKMFLLEPVEEIKKVKEWVCPEGHIYDHPGKDNLCHLCGKPQKERTALRKYKYARKESVSDLIGAMLEEEFKKRVAVGLSATGIVQQLTNSHTKDSTFAQGSFDLFFLHRPMFNSTLFLNLEAIGGGGPDRFVLSQSGLNDDASRGSTQDSDGVDRVSVREAWLQSIFMKDRLRLIGGKLDLTNYFDLNAVANDETTQFIASAFVNNPALEPPVNGPGMVAYFDTKRGYSFGLGLQSADNSGTAVTDRVYGIAEVDYYAPRLLFGLGGNYRLWGRYNGDTLSRAVGISLDQQLTQRLTSFARYGITSHTTSRITPGAGTEDKKREGEKEWAWSLGLGMRSPFSFRKFDHTALAFSQLKRVDGRKEDVAEAYYSFFLTDHLSLSLNSQLLFNSPVSDAEDEDPLATFGLRFQMDF
jgi:hypothetical protein